VIQLLYGELPPSKRHWSLVVEPGGGDLCWSDPGFVVDLYAATARRLQTSRVAPPAPARRRAALLARRATCRAGMPTPSARILRPGGELLTVRRWEVSLTSARRK
jgi:hypothetical protein